MKQRLLTLILTLFTLSLFAQDQPVQRSVTRVMERTIKGKKWELTLVNDEVKNIKVNGKVLPKVQYSKYQSEVDELKVAAYEMQPDQTLVNGDKIVTAQEMYVADGGDLTPEQKMTNQAIEDELLRDGLIVERSYKLDLNDKGMTLNGKAMTKSLHDKYSQIYFTYSGEKTCEGCRFRLSVNKQTN